MQFFITPYNIYKLGSLSSIRMMVYIAMWGSDIKSLTDLTVYLLKRVCFTKNLRNFELKVSLES